MELRHLRYFAAVAETQSFSRAAEKLRVAQPALSRQVRDLEDEMGVRLFDRSHTGVQLTDAGRVFHGHVQKLLMQVDAAVTAAQDVARGTSGELVICNDWRLGVSVLPPTVVAFRERFPRVEVTLRELLIHEQLQELRAGRIHLGFVPRSYVGARDDLELLTVVRSASAVVVPAGHPLARKAADGGQVQLRALRKETWLMLDEKTAPGYRATILQFCRLAGFTPTVGPVAQTLDGLLAQAASGFGVFFVPRFLCAQRDLRGVRLLVTDAEPFELCAVWMREGGSQLLGHFLETLREQLRLAGGTEQAPTS